MRIIYSVLKEINELNFDLNENYYKMKQFEFIDFMQELQKKSYVSGFSLTEKGYILTQIKITEKGLDFLNEYSYLGNEYPQKEKLPAWVRQQ